jgi:protein-tyrosine phosphatase
MGGFVDLHCHFVPGIDDGARTEAESIELLEALSEAGFSHVVATPHMRPGMFDNDKARLTEAFERIGKVVSTTPNMPRVSLASEHYFDDIVFRRLLDGDALPYPGGRAVLLEFYEVDLLPSVAERLFDLRRRKLIPVIAHPERYRCLWKSHERLTSLVDAGAVALLDTGALVGKYGKEPEKCARRMLEDGIYHAACSDAHRVDDVDDVLDGMRFVRKRYGADEVDFLFRQGPEEILAGAVST